MMSPTALRRLDALCVSVWAGPNVSAGVIRVFSWGRVHPWPCDPDEVFALLWAEGYRCVMRLGRRQGAYRESYVVVVGRLDA